MDWSKTFKHLDEIKNPGILILPGGGICLFAPEGWTWIGWILILAGVATLLNHLKIFLKKQKVIIQTLSSQNDHEKLILHKIVEDNARSKSWKYSDDIVLSETNKLESWKTLYSTLKVLEQKSIGKASFITHTTSFTIYNNFWKHCKKKPSKHLK